MNKWKIAFWSCFAVLILSLSTTAILLYNVIDNAFLLDDIRSSHQFIEEDFDKMIEIINNTDLSKNQIEELIKNDSNFIFIEGKTIEIDTFSLNTMNLIFENEKLKQIKKQW